jgi:hypothetical protein
MNIMTIGKRLERLEGVTGQYPQQVEAWIIDGNTSTNRITGEVITRAELAARADHPGLLRIVRNVITPIQED